MKKNLFLCLAITLVILFISCAKKNNPAAPVAENTPTRTPFNTEISTPVNTATITAANSPADSATVTSTLTVTLTVTGTSTVTETGTITETATERETVTVSPTVTDTATVTPTGTPTNTPVIGIGAYFYLNDLTSACQANVVVVKDSVASDWGASVALKDNTAAESHSLSYSAGSFFVNLPINKYMPGHVYEFQVILDSVSYTAVLTAPGGITYSEYSSTAGVEISCVNYGAKDTLAMRDLTASLDVLALAETSSAQFDEPLIIAPSVFTAGNNHQIIYTSKNSLDYASGAFPGTSSGSGASIYNVKKRDTNALVPTATATVTPAITATYTRTVTPTATVTPTPTNAIMIYASYYRNQLLAISAAEVQIYKNGTEGNHASSLVLRDATASTTQNMPYNTGYYGGFFSYGSFITPGHTTVIEATIDGQLYSATMQQPGGISVNSYMSGYGVTVTCQAYGSADSISLENSTLGSTVFSKAEPIDGVFNEPYAIADSNFVLNNTFKVNYTARSTMTMAQGAFSGTLASSNFTIYDYSYFYVDAVVPTATRTGTITPTFVATDTYTVSPTQTRTRTRTVTGTVTATVTRTATVTITPNVRGQINPPMNITPGIAYAIWLPVDENFTSVLGEYYGTAGTSLFNFGMYAATGSCYLQAWMDRDNSGGFNQGDYVTNYGAMYPAFPPSPNINVPSSSNNLNIAGWQTIPSNDVTGTFSGVFAAAGKKYMVYLDGDSNPANSAVAWNGGTCGVSSSTSFDMFAGLTGTFYLYAWVDMDGNGAINSGDYLGYYGGAGTNPPGAPNATLPGSNFNIGVSML
jgi:hypothetical protein